MAENTDMLAPSGDYRAMQRYWTTVDDILGGVETMRAGGKKYLPQFPNESSCNYQHRRKNSKFTNIFRDITENLASKPFTREVGLADDSVPEPIKAVVEDVDRAGNHLHVFAAEVFEAGIQKAIDWIFVDHTRLPQGATLADERRMGARPFWVRIPAENMLAVHSAIVDGKEEFVYARIDETYTQQDGMDEETIPCVRVLIRDPIRDGRQILGYGQARFEVWEQTTINSAPGRAKSVTWQKVDEGPISIGVIALVPFFTGKRTPGTWRIAPPMQDIADLQVEHYQQETNLKSAKELTAFPMFKGDGISPPLDKEGKQMVLPLGPSTVLYAPMNENGNHGQWGILEISAASLQFLSAQIKETEQQMRELGRQPLTAGSTGITQVAAAFASQKASSAIQAWAYLLKDALEKALRYTAQWLSITLEPTVYVNTDFAIELGSDKAPEVLLKMHDAKVISTETLRDEMKRRSILSPEFDNEAEEKRLEEELPGDDDEADILASITPPNGNDDVDPERQQAA